MINLLIKKIATENEARIRKNMMRRNKLLFLKYFLLYQTGLYLVFGFVLKAWNPYEYSMEARGWYAGFFVGILLYVWGSYIRASDVIDFEINRLKSDE